ncbi:MAG: deoxyribonuclease IV [Candidatus Methanofastidiosia archaeon]|jgi:deoxyribonuclease-4
MNIGAHVSISGGFSKVIDRIKDIDGTCGQIFTHSPRTWKFPEIDSDEAVQFKSVYQKKEIWPILIHDSYLPNLASPQKNIYQKSMQNMKKEIEAARTLGIEYIVIHPGSHTGQGEQQGLTQIADSLSEYAESAQSAGVTVLLETTAGKGTDVGCTFEQLQDIRDTTEMPTGVCLDTCHMFCAGYDITTQDGLEKTISCIDTTVGLPQVKAVHLNDSKHPFGSKKDEHAHIGRGEIGEQGFRLFLNHPAIKKLPLILETPEDKMRGHKDNIQAVHVLANK